MKKAPNAPIKRKHMDVRRLLYIGLLIILTLAMAPDTSFAWSWPWKWDQSKKNNSKKAFLAFPQTNDPVATGYVKGTRTDMDPQVDVPPMPSQSIMKPARNEPWQMRFLPDGDKKDISSAIADNIARRIDFYAETGVKRPDLSIYHYENLTPELQKVQDKALDNRYGKSWNDLPQSAKSDFNTMLEQKGEYAENKLVERIALSAKEIFKLELESQKPDLETWTRAQITEKVTFGLSTVDFETGQIVNRYGSIYEAYGGFLIDNAASLAGLEGVGSKVATLTVSKIYDKIVIPENERKIEAEKMYKAFDKAGNEAGKETREVDILGYRSVRGTQTSQPVTSSHSDFSDSVAENSPYLTNTVRNITEAVRPGYVTKALTGKGDVSLTGVSAYNTALQSLIAFTSQTQARQNQTAYQTQLNTNIISSPGFARNPALDAMGYSLYSDTLKAKTYLDNGEVDKYNRMVPIVNQKSKQYWGAVQNDKNYLAASQTQHRQLTGSDLPSEAPQLPYAQN